MNTIPKCILVTLMHLEKNLGLIQDNRKVPSTLDCLGRTIFADSSCQLYDKIFQTIVTHLFEVCMILFKKRGQLTLDLET